MSDTDTSAEAHDWAALRRLAEAATPGPWEEDAIGGIWSCDTKIVAMHEEPNQAPEYYRPKAPGEHAKNRTFIAAAHPAAVLALLDQRDAALAEAARMREALRQIDTMRASRTGQTQEEMAYHMRSIAKAALAAKEPGHE